MNLPTLYTKRLIIRPLAVSDAEDMYEYAKHSDVTKYLTWEPHPDLGYTKKYLSFIAGNPLTIKSASKSSAFSSSSAN